MNLTVNDVKAFAQADKELIDVVRQRIEELCSQGSEYNALEDEFAFEYNGIAYDLIEADQGNWDDEGKYQYNNLTYQLISHDNSIGSLSDNRFNLFIDLPVTRCGPYFTEYYYQYDKPTIMFAEIEYIPEKIIPAHDEVKWIS